jgi:hypothetical protein
METPGAHSKHFIGVDPYTPSVSDSAGTAGTAGLVRIGTYPRLAAQILRHRLETAAIPVMVRFDGNGAGDPSELYVPVEQADFARAVVTELDVDDEVPDTSPEAYIFRIEEHLHAMAELLDELRSRFGGR